MKRNVAVLAILLVGCAASPPLKQEFSFSNTSTEAFDCALYAARDLGLSIKSTDAVSGVFLAERVQLIAGGLLGGTELSFNFAVDKQLKVVSVRAEGFDPYGLDQSAKLRKFVDEFQLSFKKRCAVSRIRAEVAPASSPSPSVTGQSAKPHELGPSPKETMTISEIQTRLIELGFLKGKADGIRGNNTADALRRFQKANGVEVTGSPDGDTISRLSAAKSK